MAVSIATSFIAATRSAWLGAAALPTSDCTGPNRFSHT
jgi:hypothetical protein